MNGFFRRDINEGDVSRSNVAGHGKLAIGRDCHIVGRGVCHHIGQRLFGHGIDDGDAVGSQVGDVGQLTIRTESDIMRSGTGRNGFYHLVRTGIYDLHISTFHISNPYFTCSALADRQHPGKKNKDKDGNGKHNQGLPPLPNRVIQFLRDRINFISAHILPP